MSSSGSPIVGRRRRSLFSISSGGSDTTIPMDPGSSSTQHSILFPHCPLSPRDPSTKVSFAPLPIVPEELKRRNSITLGVAARKNLLSGGGGGGGGGAGGGGGHGTLMMNDADWEEYKKQYEKNGRDEVIDLGAVVSSGAKSLWRKVRSKSDASNRSSAPPASPMKRPTSKNVTGLGLEKVDEERIEHVGVPPNGGVINHQNQDPTLPPAKVQGNVTALAPAPPSPRRRTSEPGFGDWGHRRSASSTSITSEPDTHALESSSSPEKRGRVPMSDSVGHSHGLDGVHKRLPSPPPPPRRESAPEAEEEDRDRDQDQEELLGQVQEVEEPQEIGTLSGLEPRSRDDSGTDDWPLRSRFSDVLGFDERRYRDLPE